MVNRVGDGCGGFRMPISPIPFALRFYRRFRFEIRLVSRLCS